MAAVPININIKIHCMEESSLATQVWNNMIFFTVNMKIYNSRHNLGGKLMESSEEAPGTFSKKAVLLGTWNPYVHARTLKTVSDVSIVVHKVA